MSHVESLSTSLPAGTSAVVIDDSPTMRRIFERELTGLGILVQTFSDGREALDSLASSIAQTNLIFSDIQMPSMDGFEFCWRLQESPWYDGTPLVMVSTLSDASSVIRVLKLGADDFIPKPFNQEDLAQIIERVLSHD